MRSKMLAVAALAMLLAPVASSAGGGRWLHIRVDESGPGGEKVRVNVPLSMVETMLPLIEDGEFSGGKFRLNDHDLDAVKLRAIWKAVREAEEGEYITVESDDENVRVSRSGAYLHVNVDERGDDGDDVKVRIPTRVLDALLAGPGEELDLIAAIRALGDNSDGELVRVDGQNERVRIWVDASNVGEESSTK
ncbi:MAG: putative NADH-quinone oxidoreductase [bacterium]|nr:MAG: putative NADH-quinone oxidoreductase [bacterium]